MKAVLPLSLFHSLASWKTLEEKHFLLKSSFASAIFCLPKLKTFLWHCHKFYFDPAVLAKCRLSKQRYCFQTNALYCKENKKNRAEVVLCLLRMVFKVCHEVSAAL